MTDREKLDKLLAEVDHIVAVLRLLPKPRLGEWNWPKLADNLERAAAPLKERTNES